MHYIPKIISIAEKQLKWQSFDVKMAFSCWPSIWQNCTILFHSVQDVLKRMLIYFVSVVISALFLVPKLFPFGWFYFALDYLVFYALAAHKWQK